VLQQIGDLRGFAAEFATRRMNEWFHGVLLYLIYY
jgi:hypothetical protein